MSATSNHYEEMYTDAVYQESLSIFKNWNTNHDYDDCANFVSNWEKRRCRVMLSIMSGFEYRTGHGGTHYWTLFKRAIDTKININLLCKSINLHIKINNGDQSW